MNAALLFGVFIVLLLINVPVALCLGGASILTIINMGLPMSAIPINIQASITKFVLLAIPLFIFAGNIMEKSGISEKLIRLCQSLVGHIRGGLAIVCVAVACFFAAISGSGPATVAALGMIIIPAMAKAGYDKGYASALTATAGGIGLIIPPSISFVVLGSITGTSIGKLFMAGVLPGLLMGVSLIVAAMVTSRKMELQVLPKATKEERWKAFKDSIWGLLMPVIILGGIYGGIFTPTEAAAISAIYGLFVGIFVYKNLSFRKIYNILVDSASQTAVVMFIIMMAALFAWLLTISGIGTQASEALVSMAGGSKFKFLLTVNILFLVAGCIMDGNSAYYIMVPILMPVALILGIDPIHLCTVMVMNIAIGLITPPVGPNLYVACGIANISLMDLCKRVVPFAVASIIALIFVTYIPQISLFLPNLLK